MPMVESPGRNRLTEIFNIYGIEQMINGPTRVTATSNTLIDQCLTNASCHIVKSGVINLSINEELGH